MPYNMDKKTFDTQRSQLPMGKSSQQEWKPSEQPEKVSPSATVMWLDSVENLQKRPQVWESSTATSGEGLRDPSKLPNLGPVETRNE